MSDLPRVVWIDTARVIAALAVVLLHVSAQVLINRGQLTTLDWVMAVGFNSATRWAVPVFVMLSGYLLLAPLLAQHTQVTIAWLGRRLSKVLLPLVVWSGLWLGLWHWWYGTPFSLSFTLQTTLFNQPFEHLYFLWVLAGLWLSTPGIVLLVRQCRRFMPLVLLLLALFAMLWPGNRFLGTFWWPYLFYYLAGWWWSQRPWPWPLWKTVGLWVTTTGLIWWGTVHLTLTVQATKNLALSEYFSPLVMLQSFAAFHLFSQSQLRLNWHVWIKRLAPLSGGVYLLHPLVYKCLTLFDSTMLSSSWLIAPVTLGVFGLSAAATYLLRAAGFKKIVF